MAVHAHPDDESSKGAATMARYVREGAQVLVCTLTGGERGDILNPAMDRPETKADMAAGRDGPGQGDPRGGAALSRVHGLRAARGRPQAPAAGGLLRADAGGRGGRAAGPRDPGVPTARHAHLRREGRLPAPGPRDDP